MRPARHRVQLRQTGRADGNTVGQPPAACSLKQTQPITASSYPDFAWMISRTTRPSRQVRGDDGLVQGAVGVAGTVELSDCVENLSAAVRAAGEDCQLYVVGFGQEAVEAAQLLAELVQAGWRHSE